MTNRRPTSETKLSLTKLFLPTTPYVVISHSEITTISEWLGVKSSRTSNLNNQDRASIKLDCFAVRIGPDRFAVPTGHLNEIRSGFYARSSSGILRMLELYNATLAAMQTAGRETLRGDQVRVLKRRNLFGGASN